MHTTFTPLDYDYFDYEGKNVVRIIGRNKEGEKIAIIDSYEPNFYAIIKEGQEKKIPKLKKRIEHISLTEENRETKVVRVEECTKHFLGKKVKALRIYITNHKDGQKIASAIGEEEAILARREYDIPLITKYIKEKKVYPLQPYQVELQLLEKAGLEGIKKTLHIKTYHLKTITPQEQEPYTPNILAYDIEAESIDPHKGNILSLALWGKNYHKVLALKKLKEPADYVEYCKNEEELLLRFCEELEKEDPDILTGYFSDGFDLPFISETAKIHNIKLPLGLDHKGPSFTRGRIPSGKITGIIHVDLYRFIEVVFSQYLQSETLGLGDVTAELLGETKEEFDFAKLGRLNEEDWKQLLSYNLQDAKITYNLAQRLWPDMKEFCGIIKEPLFDITRDRMSTHVENYITHTIDNYDEIIEKRPFEPEIASRESQEKFEGAYVHEPVPGLYENLVFFDFTSMYPSVIITYNLSKSTLQEDGTFNKKEGFFPGMLREILEKRKHYKKDYAKNPNNMSLARSNAYKLLANAAYGYQAFSGARYYCREAAAATALYARENIKKAIHHIEQQGYKIIYSDTDSIAFLQGKRTKKEILTFLEDINKNLPGIMELDLEDFYKRGLFVTTRTGTSGAKKKYALINEQGKLKIRGFETVRRDWCGLARTLQSTILESILKQGNEQEALMELKRTVEQLKERKTPKEELTIRTQLKKDIKDYKTKGPHVIAAEKMIAKGIDVHQGMIINYYIGEKEGKTTRIRDQVCLLEENKKYDVEYYLNNQLLPAVENIIELFNIKASEVLQGNKQQTLF